MEILAFLPPDNLSLQLTEKSPAQKWTEDDLWNIEIFIVYLDLQTIYCFLQCNAKINIKMLNIEMIKYSRLGLTQAVWCESHNFPLCESRIASGDHVGEKLLLQPLEGDNFPDRGYIMKVMESV